MIRDLPLSDARRKVPNKHRLAVTSAIWRKGLGGGGEGGGGRGGNDGKGKEGVEKEANKDNAKSLYLCCTMPQNMARSVAF